MTVKTATIHELDTVELTVDMPDAPLEYPEMNDAPLHAGDRGVVVFAYEDGHTFTVEFFRDGETIAIADVTADQIRLSEGSRASKDTAATHIEFAFLAQNAEHIDNTPQMDIQGAGLWSASASSLPASMPNISVIVGVGYTSDALDKDHTVSVRFVNPDGVLVGPAPNAHYAASVTRTHPKSDPRYQPEQIVDTVHIPYTTPYFSVYGRYEFRIALDGEERKMIYFTLTRPT